MWLAVVAGCAQGEDASPETTEALSPGSTASSDETTPETTDAGTTVPASSGWASNMSGEEVCAIAEPAAVEGVVGRPLAEEPTPLSQDGVGTCFLNFDADSTFSEDSVSVRVWHAEEFDGRSPGEGYQFRYDVNVAPGNAEVTEVEGTWVQAHLMEFADQVFIQIQLSGRVFELTSPSVTPEQLAALAELYVAGL